MGLAKTQWAFARDVAKLIEFAEANGFMLTFGEAFRTFDQQQLYYYGWGVKINQTDFGFIRKKRRSETLKSAHLNRLAVDFNVFIGGRLTYKADEIRPLGEYWKSLHPDNVWGGDWGWDAGHFERKYD